MMIEKQTLYFKINVITFAYIILNNPYNTGNTKTDFVIVVPKMHANKYQNCAKRAAWRDKCKMYKLK